MPTEIVSEFQQAPVTRVADPLRVLFFVEGFTDIRFVGGLSTICDLTIAVSAKKYAESGLGERVLNSRAKLTVIEIPGNRLVFQINSFRHLWERAKEFDLILSQE